MIYFIYGNQNIRIKSQTKAIVKKDLPETDEMNYVRFDGNLTVVQECLDEACSLPLGYDFKVVILENCYFLSKERVKNKIESDQDYDALVKYIENPNPQCDLILTLASGEIDTKHKVYKALVANNATIIPIKEPTAQEWNEVVKKYCAEKLGVKIDYDAIKELTIRTNGDYGLLSNSGKKLALYTDHVTLQDVVLMVARPLEDNSFQMFNYLLNGQNSKAIGLYRDLKVSNTNPITLTGMLANQFRLLDQVFYLASQKYTVDDTAKELGIKPIRVTIMSKFYRKIKPQRIREILEELFVLDKNIKSGQVDRDYAFELFLINFRID